MNKNLKTLAALLLALVMSLSLVACGTEPAPSEEPADTPAAEGQEAAADDSAEAGEDETAETAEGETDVKAQKTITLTVTYADETSDAYTIETTAEFLKEAIESTVEIEGSEGEYGYTLTSVNGVEADLASGENVYWAIYVNDEYGMYSLDTQPVTDGDSYALVYETY